MTNFYAEEAAEYADSQRIAYALVRSMRGQNKHQAGFLLDGVSGKKLHQISIILAGLSSRVVTDTQIDSFLARSLECESNGEYEAFFRDLSGKEEP